MKPQFCKGQIWWENGSVSRPDGCITLRLKYMIPVGETGELNFFSNWFLDVVDLAKRCIKIIWAKSNIIMLSVKPSTGSSWFTTVSFSDHSKLWCWKSDLITRTIWSCMDSHYNIPLVFGYHSGASQLAFIYHHLNTCDHVITICKLQAKSMWKPEVKLQIAVMYVSFNDHKWFY